MLLVGKRFAFKKCCKVTEQAYIARVTIFSWAQSGTISVRPLFAPASNKRLKKKKICARVKIVTTFLRFRDEG